MSRNFLLIIGLAISAVLALSYISGLDDVITVDELPHLGAGYSYWQQGKIYLNPEHPPLAKLVATLPIAMLSNSDKAFNSGYWHTSDSHIVQYEFAREFLYSSGNDPDQLTQIGRFSMLVFPLIALLVVAFWSYKLGGKYASLISVLFLGFSPTFLAHAKLITTDVPVASMIILALFCLSLWLKTPNYRNSISAGLGLGLALLTKFSAVISIPFYGLFILIWLIKKRGKNYGNILIPISLIFLVGWLTVHLGYAIFDRNTSTNEFLLYFAKISAGKQDGLLFNILNPLAGFKILQPSIAYILGFIQVIDHNKGGHVAYFLGEISSKGSLIYFPVVYFIKETIGHLIILLLSLALAISVLVKTGLKKINFSLDQLILGSWLVLYLVISLTSAINIGIRHIVPIYPVIAIFIGIIIAYAIQKARRKILITIAVAILLISEAIFAYPYYIPFYNILAGGSDKGYLIVADSNVDWGQDLKRFANFVDENNIKKIELAYFSGWSDPHYYLKDKFIWLTGEKYKDREDFIKNNQAEDWLAISVEFLQTQEKYAWLQKEKPIAKIGYSIFVYRLTK